MPPRVIDELVSEWRHRRGLGMYVASITRDPDDDDVQWLAATATANDLDRSRWELRYARRALGLLVSERDALDDRTGSLVARELRSALRADRNVAANMVQVAERQFDERLTAYRQVLSARSQAEGTGARLGRALLGLASSSTSYSDDAVSRAGEMLARYLGEANEMLRKSFGAAELPEDQPPSALRP
jgi:hypothetical protein